MNNKITKIMLLAFAAVSINLQAAGPTPPAPLPEFMNQQQMVQWNASRASMPKGDPSFLGISTQFYTGKPYVAEEGGYVFKYRTYNPESGSWMARDPIGFPDGPNSYKYYPNPISSIDYAGCFDWVNGGLGMAALGTAISTLNASYVTLNASMVAFVAGPEAAAAGLAVTVAEFAAGNLALSGGVNFINSGFADSTTFISQTFGGSVNSCMSDTETALSFDIGLAQGYINYVTSAASLAPSPLSGTLNALAGMMTDTLVAPEQAAYNTLTGERALTPATDSDGDPGFE